MENDSLQHIKRIITKAEQDSRQAKFVQVRRKGKVVGVAPKYGKYERAEVNRICHNVVVYALALEKILKIVNRALGKKEAFKICLRPMESFQDDEQKYIQDLDALARQIELRNNSVGGVLWEIMAATRVGLVSCTPQQMISLLSSGNEYECIQGNKTPLKKGLSGVIVSIKSNPGYRINDFFKLVKKAKQGAGCPVECCLVAEKGAKKTSVRMLLVRQVKRCVFCKKETGNVAHYGQLKLVVCKRCQQKTKRRRKNG